MIPPDIIIIGVINKLIYFTLFGKANKPTPNDIMDKLKIPSIIDPGSIFPSVFFQHRVLYESSLISSKAPSIILTF